MRYALVVLCLVMAGPSASADAPETYYPPPDAQGGWRTATTAEEAGRLAGIDLSRLDQAFALTDGSSKNGGLLVVRRGYLVYERYFGLGSRDAMPNLASCGKSFTSVAVGMLIAEHPELFPEGLDQKVFSPAYMPATVFPLSDPGKADIRLGQLLSFTAGIRGNNPSYVHGKEVTIDPAGPDGIMAMDDLVAAGTRAAGNSPPLSAQTLWCKPGEGYSYATSSIHLASMMVRHVSGKELNEYLRTRLAEPLGWGRWGFGYRGSKSRQHTPGGGGITLRSTDMLRFGYLMLHDGRWNDRQLIPADYARACRSSSPYNPHYPYSLQFNINATGQLEGVPRDAFWKGGSGGHLLYVVPSLDLVVWKLAGRDGQYQKSDTGFDLPPESFKGAGARKNWKPSVPEKEAHMKVLRAVVESVQK